MRFERIALSGPPGALAAGLRALVPAPGSVSDQVAEIIAEVRAEGDAAVLAYTRKLDTGDADPRALTVSEDELREAEEALDPSVRRGLERAIANVEVVAAARMSGTQAISALAYGTASVTAVDAIVGPGNLYVQEAKRQVSGQVGIDGFAGPSDLLVIADGDAEPEPLALDLLAQAEHGRGTLVVAVSCSETLLDVLEDWLHGAPDTGT